MTEREVVLKLYEIEREGAAARDSGAVCPYPGNSLFHYIHSVGWLKRDLQLALCRAKPSYRESQRNSVTEEHLNNA